MKHKHAEVIKAWADGAEIQHRPLCGGPWFDSHPEPKWLTNYEYRVKPQPKQLWGRPYIRDDGWTGISQGSSQNDFEFLNGLYKWAGPAVLVWEEK